MSIPTVNMQEVAPLQECFISLSESRPNGHKKSAVVQSSEEVQALGTLIGPPHAAGSEPRMA